MLHAVLNLESMEEENGLPVPKDVLGEKSVELRDTLRSFLLFVFCGGVWDGWGAGEISDGVFVFSFFLFFGWGSGREISDGVLFFGGRGWGAEPGFRRAAQGFGAVPAVTVRAVSQLALVLLSLSSTKLDPMGSGLTSWWLRACNRSEQEPLGQVRMLVQTNMESGA